MRTIDYLVNPCKDFDSPTIGKFTETCNESEADYFTVYRVVQTDTGIEHYAIADCPELSEAINICNLLNKTL